MKKINKIKIQSLKGGVCVAPSASGGNVCLPCAATVAMGGALIGVGGMPVFICPL